jgi:hypothetical protein
MKGGDAAPNPNVPIPGYKEIGDTYVLHFLKAYTEEQRSFSKKFSGNAGSDVAKYFLPPAVSGFTLFGLLFFSCWSESVPFNLQSNTSLNQTNVA